MILHYDQDTNFNSALFSELCKLLGIQKTRTTALHPESDGMEPKSGFLQRFPCDVTPCQEHYKYSAVGFDGERLWSANAFEEESVGVSSAMRARKTGELRAIESAVTVIISELLSVCVARSGNAVTVIASDLTVCIDNLYKFYCSCYSPGGGAPRVDG
ncbi:hypothetical protein AVEN_18164-1 [Araneus ventricosus]|uniref:Integrase catalytic domain-containing protein n=1 Tax=Araneus ventricosus TaxID=182803 RepID=A0A4Y2AIF6_ARAVE|nr:hypothetical protein AVEN_18164-1 [Araneus ventricosus]